MISEGTKSLRPRAIFRSANLPPPQAESVLNPVEMRLAPQIQRFAADRRGRHETAIEFALAKLLELAARLQHGRFSVVAEEIETALGVERRCGEIPAHSIAPDFRAGLRLNATDDAAIVLNAKEQIIDEHQRRLARNVALGFPGDLETDVLRRWQRLIHVDDLPRFRALADGEKLSFRPTGGEIDQPVPRDGPRTGGMAGSFLDPPQFLAGQRFVAVRRLGTLADEHRLAIDHRN